MASNPTSTTAASGPSEGDARTLFAQLASPFHPNELDWRVARSGMSNGKPWAQVLVYIDARAARARLNTVVGPENWKVDYTHGPANGVLATLSLRIGGEWIAKQDGADVTDIEPVKGALSGAFKRACAVWGIGEYLYDIGDSWAMFSETGAHRVKIDGQTMRWDPPRLAPQFMPTAQASATPATDAAVSKAAGRNAPAASSGQTRTASAAPANGNTGSTSGSTSGSTANGNGGGNAARSGRTPTIDTALATLMPFGRTKGRPLADIPIEDLRKARAWAEDNGKSYPEFMAASAVLLAMEGTPTQAAATQASGPAASGGRDEGDWPAASADDLPF